MIKKLLNNKWCLIAIAFIAILFLSGCANNYDSQTASSYSGNTCEDEKDQLQDQVSELEDEVDNYKDALNEANNKIRNAKFYEWSSYEEMGDALESLDEVMEP